MIFQRSATHMVYAASEDCWQTKEAPLTLEREECAFWQRLDND